MAMFLYTARETRGQESAYPFETVNEHGSNNYNRNSREINIPEDGVYYFSMSVGIPAYQAVNFSLYLPLNENIRPAVVRTHTQSDGVDTMSRDGMFSLLRGAKLKMRSSGRLYSDAFKLTSLSAFSLTDTMSTPRYFYVYRRSGTVSNNARIQFTDVILNEGNNWNRDANSYVCPVSGIFVFTFSVFVDPADIVRSHLRVGNKRYELLREHTQHGMNGGDVLSRTVLTTCNAGQTVSAELTAGVIQGQDALTTGLMGFQYNPSKAQNVYWSLSRNTEVVNDGVGLADYLFTNQDEASPGLNIQRSGNLYRSVICPASGWYFVHLTAVTMPGFRMNLFITVAGQRQVALFRSSAWHNGAMDYMSRSAIITCRSGSPITVQIGGRQAVGRTASQRDTFGTSFVGFMLYNDNNV